MAANIITPGVFDKTKLKVLPAVYSKDGQDYHTMTLKYAGSDVSMMSTTDEKGTLIKENDKKPGMLSQGFHITDPRMEASAAALERAIWEGVLAQKNSHDKLPDYLKGAESVEDLLAAGKFIKMKGILHRPKVKPDAPDSKPDPLIYGQMIQCGAKHATTPFKVFSKYWDAIVLTPDIRKKIKEHAIRKEEFLQDVQALWKKKLVTRGKWSMVVVDVFISASTLKIRKSIKEVWIESFEEPESVAEKALAAMMEASGAPVRGTRLIIPEAAPVEDAQVKKGQAPSTAGGVVKNPLFPPDAEDVEVDIPTN